MDNTSSNNTFEPSWAGYTTSGDTRQWSCGDDGTPAWSTTSPIGVGCQDYDPYALYIPDGLYPQYSIDSQYPIDVQPSPSSLWQTPSNISGESQLNPLGSQSFPPSTDALNISHAPLASQGSDVASITSPSSVSASTIQVPASSKPTTSIATSQQAKPHTCDRCPKSFRRNCDLRRHYRIHFPSQRTFNCHIHGCNRHGIRAFYRKHKLADHQKKVHGL